MRRRTRLLATALAAAITMTIFTPAKAAENEVPYPTEENETIISEEGGASVKGEGTNLTGEETDPTEEAAASDEKEDTGTAVDASLPADENEPAEENSSKPDEWQADKGSLADDALLQSMETGNGDTPDGSIVKDEEESG